MSDQPITTEADAKREAEKRKEAANQTRMAYGRVFGTPDGERILADLQAAFGWREGVETSAYRPDLAPEAAIHRDGQRDPIRHILRMINAGKPKPNEA